jgi:ribosome-associated protein
LKSELGVTPLGVEGLRQGRWILIDLGDIIVNIFDEPMRSYYDLDGLWLDAKKVSPEDLGLSEGPPAARELANPA